MMRFVYVLVSDEQDFYYEECLISIISLKKNNPNAEILLLTDNKTAETMTGFRGKIKEYVSKVIIHSYSDSVSKKIRSRILKTSMRKLVTGEFLYIDTDTIIAEEIETEEFAGVKIGMVLDQHVRISEHYRYNDIWHNAAKAGCSAGYQDRHFNSGVIYVSDERITYTFFDMWHQLYLQMLKKGISIDQVSLNEANAQMNGVIAELDGKWNVQINCGLKYLYPAKIIHYLGYQPLHKQNKYFNTLPFLLCENRYFKEMKESQEITNEVKSIIEHPKTAFKTVTIIPDDCVAYKLLYSNHMRILKFIYVKCQVIYRVFEFLYGKLFFVLFKRY